MQPFTTADRCRVVISKLAEQRLAVKCWVGPYCLMPDHQHLIVGTNEGGVSVWELLRRFHGSSTNALWPTGWTGRVWQPRGYDVLLRDGAELLSCGEYILENPVRAGLVAEPEDWAWSGWLDDPEDLGRG